MHTITLAQLEEADIPGLTGIMMRAFDADSMMHLGKRGGPPGYDTGEFLRKYGLDPHCTALKILVDGRASGAALLWVNEKTHRNWLGNVFIDPDLQEKGIEFKVWKKIEALYPDTEVWGAQTPIFSHRNHHFYVNKCGFHIVRIENPRDLEEGSYVLEKIMR